MPHTGATAAGVKPAASRRTSSSPSTCAATAPRSTRPLGEQDVHEPEEEEGVGARSDRKVLVGLLRGLRPPRVDDDDLAAASPQRLEPAREVGCGHQRAVRRVRVRAEHQEIVGAVDVGDRDRERAAEHQPGRHLLRHLVDRARGVDVLRARGLQQHAVVREAGKVVRARVAEIDRQRVGTVPLTDRGESRVDRLERLVPRDLVERVAAAHQRLTDPIRIGFELLQRRALRAQETVTEDVVAIAAHERDRAPVEMELEPARRLTQMAGTKGRALGSGAHDQSVRRIRCRGMERSICLCFPYVFE